MRQRKGIWRVCVWLCHSKQGASVTQRVTGRTVSAFPGCAGCGESLTLFVSQDHGVKFQPVTDGVTEMFSSRKKLQFCAVVTFLSHTLYCCPPFPVPPPCSLLPAGVSRNHLPETIFMASLSQGLGKHKLRHALAQRCGLR